MAADQPRSSLIPHSKAGGQYLNSVLAKIESKRGGYEEAILLDEHRPRLRGLGREHVRGQGRHASPLRPRRPASSTASAASRSSRSPRDLGLEIVERDVARAELTLADEVFMVGTAAELVPVREIDDIEIGPPGEITRQIQTRLRRRPPRARARATRSGSTWCRYHRRRERRQRLSELPGRALGPSQAPARSVPIRTKGVHLHGRQVLLYDTTLRDGMQGEGMSLSADEKVRVAHALDSLGVHLIEAGFPSSNPKEEALFDLLSRRDASSSAEIAAFGMTRRRDVAADGDEALRVLADCFAPGLHAGGQDVVAAPGEGHARGPRGEPADDRRLGGVPARRRASG